MGKKAGFWLQMGTAMARLPLAQKPKRTQVRRPNATTTAEQVNQVLDLRELRGWSAARIANKTGIPASTIQGIINGNGTRTVANTPRST